MNVNFFLLQSRCDAARPARSPVHLHIRMRSSVHLDTRAHLDRSSDFVNQLEKLVTELSCSFAGKGSQVEALRIESPPSGKHPWTTATLESRS